MAAATVGQTASISIPYIMSGGYSINNNNLHVGHSLSKRSPFNPLKPVAFPAALVKSQQLGYLAWCYFPPLLPKVVKKSFALGFVSVG